MLLEISVTDATSSMVTHTTNYISFSKIKYQITLITKFLVVYSVLAIYGFGIWFNKYIILHNTHLWRKESNERGNSMEDNASKLRKKFPSWMIISCNDMHTFHVLIIDQHDIINHQNRFFHLFQFLVLFYTGLFNKCLWYNCLNMFT